MSARCREMKEVNEEGDHERTRSVALPPSTLTLHGRYDPWDAVGGSRESTLWLEPRVARPASGFAPWLSSCHRGGISCPAHKHAFCLMCSAIQDRIHPVARESPRRSTHTARAGRLRLSLTQRASTALLGSRAACASSSTVVESLAASFAPLTRHRRCWTTSSTRHAGRVLHGH